MDHEIYKLINYSILSKFLTKIYIRVDDFLGGQYSVNKNKRFKAPMLRSDLCDYSDVNIIVKETIFNERSLITLRLGHEYQKIIAHRYKMQVS